MKKRIKKFYVKHNPWFTNFTSSMCGTIIGIIITIGATIYFQKQEQKELANKIKNFTLDNIEFSIEELKYKLEGMKNTSNILQYVCDFYPNNLQDIPTDSIEVCLNQLSRYRFSIIDNSPAEIFSSNIEIWKVAEDTELIYNIGDCFAEIKIIEKLIAGLEAKQVDTYNKYTSSISRKKATHLTPVEHINELFEVSNLYNFSYNYINDYMLCEKLLEELKEIHSYASSL